MAAGWKQLLEDLVGALGMGNAGDPGTHKTVENDDANTMDASLPEVSEQEIAPDIAASREEPEASEVTELESTPASPRRKLFSFGGLIGALALAIAVGWYVYFGQPKPPAPDVVATFDGGQITVQDVVEHLALLTHGQNEAFEPSYEDYRLVVQHMLLNELVRRWAAEQRMDASARFKDAMRHISESVTLDEWVAQLHQDEMLSAVSESQIQAYYEANQSTFANATLEEVREQIRQTLAHQDQETFFKEYVARLRSEATITRDYELLVVPEPTDDQLRKFYNDNVEQFSLPERALVDRIYVPTEGGGGAEADDQARTRAEEARAALQAGKDFVEVSGKYSQEPYKPEGVIIEAGTDDPELVEQASSLSQEGDLSPVISTGKGYYILRLRSQQPARQLSWEEARPQLLTAVRTENEKAWFEQNSDRTLFTIHGERFTLGEFYHEYQNLSPELQKQFSGSEGLKRLADLLIDRMLMLDDAYNKLVDQENAPLLEEARTAVLRQMIHEAEVDSRVNVTEQDIRNFYEEQREYFSTPPEARIASIRISLGETEDERKQARKRAQEAYQKLVPGFARKPADFNQVAQEYDESDQAGGNSLGEWIRMGDDPVLDLVAHPLHEYIFTLPVDGVSLPFEYGQDIYIIKILERVEPRPLEFDQVKDSIRKELETAQHQQFDAEVAARLLREAHGRIYDQVIQNLLVVEQVTPEP